MSSSPDTIDTNRFAVLDIETSGLSSRWHRILQVAVVSVVDGRIVDEWSSLVQLRWPWQRVGPTHVHGLTRSMLRHAPSLRSVMPDVAQRVAGHIVVAHNIKFDWAFLVRAAQRTGVSLQPAGRLCTLYMSRKLDPERELSHRLGDVIERYGVTNAKAHDALGDARATAEVLPHLIAAHHAQGVHDVTSLLQS